MSALSVRVVIPGRLDIDVQMGPGCTAVVGPSGAGKTTLLSVLAGLERATEARVSLGDVVLEDTSAGVCLPPERRGLGLQFQEARLFPHLTVSENIAYPSRHGGRTDAPEVAACAEALGIGELLDRPAGQLSGGEARRVALARALAAAQRLLLLDEPLGGLDEGNRERILPWLHRLITTSRVPTVLVTHRMSEAAFLASHVIALQDGRVAATGSPLDVLPAFASVSSRRELDAENLLSGRVDAKGDSVTVGAGSKTLRLSVAAHDLPPGAEVAVRLAAGDIIVGLSRHDDLSARNTIDGRIVALHDVADGVLAYVDAGALLQVSLTADAVTSLGLTTGKDVVLYVKTTALTLSVANARG